jgi:peptide/nickel transport system permease protein
MLWFLTRRIAFGCAVLFAVSVLTFLIYFKLPAGDPARMITRKPTTSREYQLARQRLGLDEPILVQYARYAKGMIPLPGLFLDRDVYFSYQSNIPVRDELLLRGPYTMVLGIGGVLLTLAIAVPLGVAAGLRPRSRTSGAADAFVLTSISIPPFWLGALLLYVFWFRFGIAPSSGIPATESAIDAALAGRYVLPWITEAIALGAIYVQLLRSEVTEVMRSDYVRTAKAKGVRRRRIVVHHVARASLSSVVTVLAYDIATVVAGAVVIETVFNIPGIGRYAVQAVSSSDLPVVMGTTVVFALAIVAAGIALDVAYLYLDPRVRYGSGRA